MLPPYAYSVPVVELTSAVSIVLGDGDVNTLFIVKNTAAIDFTLPALVVGAWIDVHNDSGSTNNIVVKDVDANPVTGGTLTPGTKKKFMVDSTGLESAL